MLLLALLACDKADVDTDAAPDCDGVDWPTHGRPFVEVCTECHSASLTGDERQGAPEALSFDPPAGVEGFAAQMVAVGTGDDPRMPPDGMDAAVREAFALWVECGLPGLVAPCAGDTFDGDLRVSEAPDAFCETGRWVTGDLVIDGPSEPVACVCGVGGDLRVEADEAVLPELQRIDGDLALVATPVSRVDLPALETLRGALLLEGNPLLGEVSLGRLRETGRVSVRDNGSLATLAVGSLAQVTGSLVVRDNAVLGGLDLGSLTAVGGVLAAVDNPLLVSFGAPDALVSVPDGIEIVGNPALTGLSGFAALDSATGTLRVAELNPGTVDVFPLVRAAGAVQLTDLGPLTELHAFQSLETVAGTVRVAHLGSVGSLDLLGHLRHVEGGLVVDDIGNRAVIGFPQLESVGGGLEIAYCSALTEVRFESLTAVGGLVVQYDPVLPDLDGLQGLTSVGGAVEIHHLLALTTLTGLDNVAVIDGGLRLESLPALVDLNALASLEAVHGDLLVREVGGYTVPELEALFAQVAIDGNVTIE